jgi:hypothetical protein
MDVTIDGEQMSSKTLEDSISVFQFHKDQDKTPEKVKLILSKERQLTGGGIAMRIGKQMEIQRRGTWHVHLIQDS